MLKHLLIILVFFHCGQNSFGQYKSLNEIIPKDFAILDSAFGYINKVGIKDLVLLLKNKYEKLNYDKARHVFA